ncbi:MAG: hypothetical protein CENE_02402 [Candidatus Celerinatantimonas neptuna]|nr:MAG: hypothetical protein CENE_02402 [Candidatus Celerinatantimonas neptuna]
MAAKIEIASIRSEGRPQQGQHNRSSGNFSTEGIPGGYNRLYWQVSDIKAPNSVQFDVMMDRSGGIDSVEFERLQNTSITEVKKFRALYIATPRGTDGSDFKVTVYATNS